MRPGQRFPVVVATAADAGGLVPDRRFIPNKSADAVDIFLVASDVTSVNLRLVQRIGREFNMTDSEYAGIDDQYPDSSQDFTITANGNTSVRYVITPGMDFALLVTAFTGGASKRIEGFGMLVNRA